MGYKSRFFRDAVGAHGAISERNALNSLEKTQAKVGRPVSGLERVWLAADRVRKPFAIGWVVRGHGALDVEAWRAAVEAVARRWPLTTAALAGAGRHLRWVPTGRAPAVTVNIDADAGARGLDPQTGAVAALTLVPGEHGPQLVFWGHHALFDARALAAWAEQVAAACRGEAVAPEGAPPALASLGRAPRAQEPPADQWPVLGQRGAERGTCWGWRRISGGSGSPVVPVLRALATLAAADHGALSIRVGVPVDLRPRAAQWPEPGPWNLTGVAQLEVGAVAEAPTVAAAVRALADGPWPLAHARGAEGLKTVPLCVMGWVGRRSLAQRIRTGRSPTAAVVSNVGRCLPEALNGAGFVADFGVWAPPRSPGLPLFVMLGGDAGGVSVSAAMPRALASEGRLDRLLDALASAIRG